MSSFFGGSENCKHKITINLVDIDHIRYNFHLFLIFFLKVRWNYSSIAYFL